MAWTGTTGTTCCHFPGGFSDLGLSQTMGGWLHLGNRLLTPEIDSQE
jgi:hypothetical protein